MLFALCSCLMKNLIACLLFLLCFTTACHRPYALYQRTAPQTYHSARPAPSTPATDSTGWAALVPDSSQSVTAPVAYASARPTLPPTPHSSRITRSLTKTVAPLETSTEPMQPKPKPKAKGEPPRKTLREVLGLKPRPQLNWWQRISWKLKAAAIVILVALLFAIFKITILAIIFGLLGAFLLIKGLKKSFKVRRPWF